MQTTLGPLEQTILSEIWKQKTATVRSVLDSLQSERELAYTTVMTIMTRLTEKNILERKKQGKGYVYSPINSKQNFIQNMIRATMATIIDHYGEEAMTAFLAEAESLSQSEKETAVQQLQHP